MKGDPLEQLKDFREKTKIENFERCHSAERCKRGNILGFFDNHSVAKYQKNRIQKFFEESLIVPKKSRFVKNNKINKVWILRMFLRFWASVLFRRGSDNSNLSWASVVQIEQMNKKWTLHVLKKLKIYPLKESGTFPEKRRLKTNTSQMKTNILSSM